MNAHKVSLRHQINTRIILASVFILFLASIISIWQARSSVKKELDSSLKLANQLIQINIHNPIALDSWLPHFLSLEQSRHLSIRLYQPSGEILEFSSKNPQIGQKPPPAWYVRLISAESQKIEQHLTGKDGKAFSLIIQANPMDEIGEAWQESLNLFSILVLLMALVILMVNLLFNKAFKAISGIVNTLKAIEQGNYAARLPEFTVSEYNDIANAVNHMAAVLDATRSENQALTGHILQIQEEERQLLAKEMHDELGQSLTAVKVLATTAKNIKGNPAPIANKIIDICDHLSVVVQSMMRHLHPLALTELGLKASLEDLLNHWLEGHPDLILTLSCPDTADNLDHKITIQIFRVVQECLTNIMRHADATQAHVRLELKPDKRLLLEIVDNGKGCDLKETKKGFGLLGIRERITILGGNLSIQTEHQQGMKICAEIPLA
jgi:two-component system, NarL family, sensor histidine kinase UhpB